VLEQRGGHVQVSVGAARALVHDSRGSGLAVCRDLDLLEAVGSGVSATVLRGVECDDEVRVGRDLTTCSETWIMQKVEVSQDRVTIRALGDLPVA
jgi:hypothetical protein